MDREALLAYAAAEYHTDPEYLFSTEPDYAVLRHTRNRKWYAVIMRVPRRRLGLAGEEPVDIVNVKCDPMMSGSLRADPGILPAYHMNKEKWLSVLLDGTVEAALIKVLLDRSFVLTDTPPRRKPPKA